MPTTVSKPKSIKITKKYNDTEVVFELSVLEHDVRIHAITICSRDIFHIIDPEIRRTAYEEFKHQFINVEA